MIYNDYLFFGGIIIHKPAPYQLHTSYNSYNQYSDLNESKKRSACNDITLAAIVDFVSGE